MFGGHCLAFARISRFMEHTRQMTKQGRNIEEKALAKHCMAQDFILAQEDFIRFIFSFIALLKNSE